MKDKELYDFFKNGSAAYDEMPSASLWEKIENNLKTPNPTPFYKKTIFKVVLLLVTAALVTALVLFINQNSEENQQPQQQKETENTFPIIDTITVDTMEVATLPLEKISIENKSVQSKKDLLLNLPEEETLEDDVFSEPKAEFVGQEKTSEATIMALKEDTIETKTYKNRIVYRLKQKLSKEEFDKLTAKILKENESSGGMMIVVIAPGHPTFRKMISGEKVIKGALIKYDSLALKPKIITFSSEYIYEADLSSEKDSEQEVGITGGFQKFNAYLSKSFNLPDKTDLNGKVTIQFVVNTDGSLSDFKIINDQGYGTGKEAIRVIKSYPEKWTPASKDGKAIRSTYNLPILISTH